MVRLGEFKYVATTREGKRLSGVVTAVDKGAAMRKIRQNNQGAVIQACSPRGIDWNMELTTPKIQVKALSFACSQFKVLLKAGLPLVRSIEVIAEQSTDRYLSKTFGEAAGQVAEGARFSDCLERANIELPTVFIETLRAGEESGTLDNSFAKMEAYFSKAYKLKSKIRAALSYPIIMLVVAFAVVNIIVLFALPSFIPMFGEEGLPGPTQMLLDYYYFSLDYWWLFVAICIGVAIVFKLWVKTEHGALVFALIQSKMPIIGSISEMNSASQFANTLSTLLASGLSVVRALEITSKVISNKAVGRSVRIAIHEVTEGATVGGALKKNTMLPKLLLEMVEIGEASGSLEETLDTIAKYYDEEAQVVIDSALAKIEPIMTCILGVIIGFIMIALYLPIFNMSF